MEIETVSMEDQAEYGNDRKAQLWRGMAHPDSIELGLLGVTYLSPLLCGLSGFDWKINLPHILIKWSHLTGN